MTPENAIELLTKLVETNMAQGGIKNFETLDHLRNALKVLTDLVNSKK